jgi:hypothetical protein
MTNGAIDDHGVYILGKVCDDKNYEGFGMEYRKSTVGNDELLDDMTPAFGVGENSKRWKVHKLRENWCAPEVSGKVSNKNDYPCINLIYPAYSNNAVNCLRKELISSGELLPLKCKFGDYYFHNITKVVDAIDVKKSKVVWHVEGVLAMDVIRHEFNMDKIQGLSLFRAYVDPMTVYAKGVVVRKIVECGLRGFEIYKAWPLKKPGNWRKEMFSLK